MANVRGWKPLSENDKTINATAHTNQPRSLRSELAHRYAGSAVASRAHRRCPRPPAQVGSDRPMALGRLIGSLHHRPPYIAVGMAIDPPPCTMHAACVWCSLQGGVQISECIYLPRRRRHSRRGRP
jgi:hypothetical protein